MSSMWSSLRSVWEAIQETVLSRWRGGICSGSGVRFTPSGKNISQTHLGVLTLSAGQFALNAMAGLSPRDWRTGSPSNQGAGDAECVDFFAGKQGAAINVRDTQKNMFFFFFYPPADGEK